MAKTSNPFAEFELAKEMPNAPTAAKRDPVQFRRDTFLEALNAQRNMWTDPTFTIERVIYKEGDDGKKHGVKSKVQPRKWWVKMGDVFWVTARYGNRPIDLTSGNSVVKLKEDQVPTFFKKLESAVSDGYFDEQFQKLSTRQTKVE